MFQFSEGQRRSNNQSTSTENYVTYSWRGEETALRLWSLEAAGWSLEPRPRSVAVPGRRVVHGYIGYLGYLHLGSIADTGYFGYLCIADTAVLQILAQGQYCGYLYPCIADTLQRFAQRRRPNVLIKLTSVRTFSQGCTMAWGCWGHLNVCVDN